MKNIIIRWANAFESLMLLATGALLSAVLTEYQKFILEGIIKIVLNN